MIRAVALSQGSNSPSSRFRVHQIADYINTELSDVRVDTLVSYPGSYPPKSRGKRIGWLLSALLDGARRATIANRFDVCLLHREMISTVSSFEGLIKIPKIFDVDDAIWLTSRMGGIERICRSSEHLIAGNHYIAEKLGTFFDKITIIPTAVDSKRFLPSYTLQERAIVWSGSSSGLQYLYDIEIGIKKVLQMNKGWKLKVVCNEQPKFTKLDDSEVDFIKWTAADEVRHLQTASIGIMPLRDTEWERAKCSYKMLTYMACGLPVVVSPVGMNIDVLSMGGLGRPASNITEWVEIMDELIKDGGKRFIMGEEGRRVILERFDLPIISKQVSRVIEGYSE